MRKFNYVSSLSLQPGEVNTVKTALSAGRASSKTKSTIYPLLKKFEGSPLPSQLPAPSAFANISSAELTTFGNALVASRQLSVTASKQPAITNVKPSGTASPAAGQNADAKLDQLNTAIANTNAFTNGAATSPIGMLNLERLEMTPAGIERGGLIATIPLAPKERTCVVQQEWSVISQEFTSIVTDSRKLQQRDRRDGKYATHARNAVAGLARQSIQYQCDGQRIDRLRQRVGRQQFWFPGPEFAVGRR